MKQFVMGAVLNLKDKMSNGLTAATRSTKSFSDTVNKANRTIDKSAKSTEKANNATKNFNKAQDKAKEKTKAWATGTSKLTSALGLLKTGLIAAVGAFSINKAKEWLVDSNADMETYRNTLNIVMKDSQKAAKTLDWATTFAAKTPFEIPEVVEATTRLTTYGFQAQKVLGIVGDMASVMGKDLMQAVEAVADAQTGELERLKEFGITKAAITEKANKLGIKPIDKKGSITDMKGFNAALFALMEDRYNNGMETQSKTFKGMISNAQDFIGTMGRTLGKPIFDRLKVQLERVMNWAQGIQASGVFDRWAASIGSAIDRIGGYFKRLADDQKFKEMSLGEKFIFVLQDMLSRANDFMMGSGGTKVKEIFRMVTTIMIEVLQGAVTKLMPIAVSLGTQIGAAIITGMGEAIKKKMDEPMAELDKGLKAMGEKVAKNPWALISPENGTLGVLSKFLGKAGKSTATQDNQAKSTGHNANGTRNWRGGWSWVGERGPELMRIPRGAQIRSNYESRQMVNPAGNGGASSSGHGLSISGNFVDKLVIEGGAKDPQQIADVVMDRLHELMRQAKEVSGNTDMGVLLT